MTLLEAAKAYRSLDALMEMKRLNGRTVLQLVRLQKSLKDAEDVLLNRQESIIQEYSDKDAQGNPMYVDGVVKASDPEREMAAKQALAELYAEPYDMQEPKKIDLRLPDIEVPISAHDVINLSPFIDFGGDYGD